MPLTQRASGVAGVTRAVYHNQTQCNFLTLHYRGVWSARKGTRALSSRRRDEGYSPESGAEWIECAGAYAVFDGIDSPVTQSFGLGIFEELTAVSLDTVGRFFLDRGAQALHEVGPLAGVAALNLLCAHNYRPVEISNVLYRPVEKPAAESHASIRVRRVGAEEAQLWTDISARGWTHEHPELLDFLLQSAAISSAREQSLCFLAEADGEPGAVGVLCVHEGVALFGGSATVPELRRRGLQAAPFKSVCAMPWSMAAIWP